MPAITLPKSSWWINNAVNLHAKQKHIMPNSHHTIAIFASGAGSNALNFIKTFEQVENTTIGLVVSNNEHAGVLNIADEYGVPKVVLNKTQLHDETYVLPLLQQHKIDFIVLAGYMLLIPAFLVKHFPNKIVNVHPALLPKFGGKGMYGKHVHQAVIDAGETETGMTIHYVNEHYDEGNIIHQASCKVEPGDTVADLTKKVQRLEHEYYPNVVASILESNIQRVG